MWFLYQILILVLISYLSSINAFQRRGIKTYFFEQKLDHFNHSDDSSWKMRYMVNDDYFIEGGPVFLVLRDRLEIDQGIIQTGPVIDMAEQNNAVVFLIENRFHGSSKPKEELSKDNLKYLNVKQTIADAAYFIKIIKKNHRKISKSKVIVFGYDSGEYPVLLKQLYPKLINGVWAKNPKLFVKLDLPEFYENKGKIILQKGGSKCYNRIKNGIKMLENMFTTNQTDQVVKLLNLCDDFDQKNDDNISYLFEIIIMYLTTVIDNKGCHKIMSGIDDLDGILKYVLQFLGQKPCLKMSYEGMLSRLKNTTNMGRASFYQKCNEFGSFPTTSSAYQPFGTKLPLKYYINMCAKVFGKEYTIEYIQQKIDDFNEIFGGKSLDSTNIYISNNNTAIGQLVKQWCSLN